MVKVGGYSFAPFVSFSSEGKASGLTPDLLEVLNESQDEYRFVFVSTTPQGRYADFQNRRFDMMFFENRDWGWASYPVASSRAFLEGGELYISRKLPGRNQDFFGSMDGKKIVGIRGFHYGFSDFEALDENRTYDFQALLVENNSDLIQAVLDGRADVGVITCADLKSRMARDAKLKNSLLVSKRYDQVYRHQAIVRQQDGIDETKIDSLMMRLEENGRLRQLWSRYGLEDKSAVKTYVIGVENTQYFPYYDFSSSGEERSSFGRELLDSFAKERGYRFIYEASPVKRLFLKLVKGVVDFKYPDNPAWGDGYKQEKPIIYSDSTVRYTDGTLVLKPLKGRAKIKMLGTVMGFTPVPYHQQIDQGKVSVLENANFDGLIQQAIFNRVDGIYANVDVVPIYLTENFGMSDSLVYDPSLPHIEGHYYLSTMRHPQIIKEFNTYLKDNRSQLEKMKQRYGVGRSAD